MTEHDLWVFVLGMMAAAILRALLPRSPSWDQERLARVERKLDQLLGQAGLSSSLFLSSSSAASSGASPGVQRLIQEGKMINAIKLYREETGVGLKEAKDAVEAMAAQMSVL